MIFSKDAADGRYKVVFCDTDCLPALETKRGDRTTNEVEAALIKQVLHVLTRAKSRPSIPFVKEVSQHPRSE
jgi:hypothetical protein